MNLKGFAGLGLDPFSIDVGNILLKERGIVELSSCVSGEAEAAGSGRTGGMLWLGMAYVLTMIFVRVKG